MPDIAVCLGSSGSGKTTLLRKLQKSSREDDTEPLPTVGVNHFSVDIPPLVSEETKCFSYLQRKKRGTQLSFREFGGALAPAWLTYLNRIRDDSSVLVRGLLFVVDASCSARFAEAGVHLVDIVEFLESQKSNCRILLVLSKLDLIDECCLEKTLNNLKTLLRLDYLANWCKFCVIEHCEYSAISEEGLCDVINWCRSLY